MSLSAQPIAIHANEVFRRASIDATTATTDYLPTGFADLDRIIHGLPRGGLTVLAGGPLSCKTILAANIVEHVAMPETVNPDNQRKPEAVLVFLTGISPRYYALKTMCRLAGLKTSALNEPQLDEATKAKLAKASHRLSTAPIYLCEVRGDDITTLRDRSVVLHQKLREQGTAGLSLIAFDNLRLLYVADDEESYKKELRTAVLISLKNLAEELNVAVLALFEPMGRTLVDGGGEDNGKLQSQDDLKWHRAIKNTAELVMNLSVAPDSETKGADRIRTTGFELAVLNNRNGPIGTVDLLFDREDSWHCFNRPKGSR